MNYIQTCIYILYIEICITCMYILYVKYEVYITSIYYMYLTVFFEKTVDLDPSSYVWTNLACAYSGAGRVNGVCVCVCVYVCLCICVCVPGA